MLQCSEVWTRAYHEGRECPVRLNSYEARERGEKCGTYFFKPLCAIGLLIEPYKEEIERAVEDDIVRRSSIAPCYGVTPDWLDEAEDRYEGTQGYSRHTLLELADWARAQGH